MKRHVIVTGPLPKNRVLIDRILQRRSILYSICSAHDEGAYRSKMRTKGARRWPTEQQMCNDGLSGSPKVHAGSERRQPIMNDVTVCLSTVGMDREPLSLASPVWSLWIPTLLNAATCRRFSLVIRGAQSSYAGPHQNNEDGVITDFLAPKISRRNSYALYGRVLYHECRSNYVE